MFKNQQNFNPNMPELDQFQEQFEKLKTINASSIPLY